MKKFTLFTLALLCLLCLTSSAQISKGSVLLGGGIGASKNRSATAPNENTSASFAFYPAIGVAIKENTVVGLRLSYAHSKSDQKSVYNSDVQEMNGYSTGLFYRRYMELGKKFYLFGEGAAYYGHNKNQTEYKNSNTKYVQTTNVIGLNFYPGVAYAVSRKIHLEAGLNNLVDISYSSTRLEAISSGTSSVSKGSGFGVSTNVSTSAPLSVGFRFVLGK